MDIAKFHLLLDKRWELEELSDVGRAYNQLYAFFYSTLPDSNTDAEIRLLYSNLPWRGGYSTVNFFNNVFHRIPAERRPQILKIQYASPGFIELAGIVGIATLVSIAVMRISMAIRTAHETYRQIQAGITAHRLNKLEANLKELQLEVRQAAFAESACVELVRILGISKQQDQVLDARTKGNKVMKLKLLMSVYRRAEKLAEKQYQGKLHVRNPAGD